jgi:hypothetical protein
MISVFLLALLAPPAEAPPADRLEAAVALWEAHPLPDVYLQRIFDGLVINATYQALKEARIRNKDRSWADKYERMRARLAARVPADRRRLDRQAGECVVDGIARSLSVAEIEEVRRFAATPAGAKFWEVAMVRPDWVRLCYDQALQLWPQDSDYRAAGLRPPKPKRYRGDIVS